ncbi:hypothetical protein Z043_111575 [Scleropages formosus]|uniref:Myb/SANT-like DNA-binding domain-containing protein n=1 Tax=Scleropages formosus TaxID=113540 RepID=A0A0P7UIG3_SCLFO|nr:hypothetical protein Z043_111575 [Scleropages formosus]
MSLRYKTTGGVCARARREDLRDGENRTRMSALYCGHDGVMHLKKRKARFTFSEVHILLDEVRKNRHIVVGK